MRVLVPFILYALAQILRPQRPYQSSLNSNNISYSLFAVSAGECSDDEGDLTEDGQLNALLFHVGQLIPSQEGQEAPLN